MDIFQQLNQIAQERDIPVDELIRELEEALAVSYKKYVGATGDVSVKLDPTKGWTALLQKEVVGEVMEPSFQIGLVEARKRLPEIEIGDFLDVEVDPNRFGRIAAMTFKQVLTQKLREAEHRRIQETFAEKLHDVVSGTVLRKEEQSVFINVNHVEAELPPREQVRGERYVPNSSIRVFVYKVEEQRRGGPRVIVSRTHPNLVRKLFELEVPEIRDGIIEIMSVAREPGQRSKIAVMSNDERIDAVGACVGLRGARVQAVVEELNDEKIDIVPFSEDPKVFIVNALSPAKVNSIVVDENEHKATVIVPDSQQSLAIGKSGQNVRLAARLTGWGIDIKSDSQAAEDRQRSKAE